MADKPPAQDATTAQKVARELAAAVALHQRGHLDEAEAAYRAVLRLDRANAPALQFLGIVASQRNRLPEAVELFDRAIAIKPDYADAHNNRGAALHRLRRREEALASFDRAVALDPAYADAHNNRGAVLNELRRWEEAVASLERALAIAPDFVQAHSNRGSALMALGRRDEALASYDRALALNPTYPETHYNRSKALQAMDRLDEALTGCDRALALRPQYPDALNLRGNLLATLGRPAEALESYERVLRLTPDSALSLNNRGAVLTQMNHLQEAQGALERALALDPSNADAHNNLGNLQMALHRPMDALASYDRALALKPGETNALRNRGLALEELNRPEEALASYGEAMAVAPGLDFLYGAWLHAAMKVCDWTDYSRRVEDLAGRIRSGRSATPPFPLVAITDSAALQLQAARTWTARKYPPAQRSVARSGRPRGTKLRLGYFSADFHEHATTYLMAEVFEKHDRERFELFAFSYGPEAADAMRRRVCAAFDHFVEVRYLSDEEVAGRSWQAGIDIAVDLKGFTRQGRPGIFVHRAAPVQAAYLGYPGTMGADFMDYLIADRVVIDAATRSQYAERIAFLPGCYQANDSRRAIGAAPPTRRELGLPENVVVYCCFNNNFKITPAIFDAWMRILRSVEGSALWLLEDNPAAARNLRLEAGRRGVDSARLVFAGRLPLAEHLARHGAADLFLDTLPCNAHTTASDALWAGLPVLTRMGESFASRVAASLLGAVGLPELIASSGEEYEALAIALAREPGRLRHLKEKLARARTTAPLFDAGRLAGGLERAYLRMHERRQAGLPPEDFQVND